MRFFFFFKISLGIVPSYYWDSDFDSFELTRIYPNLILSTKIILSAKTYIKEL